MSQSTKNLVKNMTQRQQGMTSKMTKTFQYRNDYLETKIDSKDKIVFMPGKMKNSFKIAILKVNCNTESTTEAPQFKMTVTCSAACHPFGVGSPQPTQSAA